MKLKIFIIYIQLYIYIWIKLILNFASFLFSYEIFEYNIESDKSEIISYQSLS